MVFCSNCLSHGPTVLFLITYEGSCKKHERNLKSKKNGIIRIVLVKEIAIFNRTTNMVTKSIRKRHSIPWKVQTTNPLLPKFQHIPSFCFRTQILTVLIK
uniref:Uncharacterized protein n=1 Tax=Arundo donax TaxID=35708 RepID=A0A0A9BVL6_ARUDO